MDLDLQRYRPESVFLARQLAALWRQGCPPRLEVSTHCATAILFYSCAAAAADITAAVAAAKMHL